MLIEKGAAVKKQMPSHRARDTNLSQGGNAQTSSKWIQKISNLYLPKRSVANLQIL